MGVSLVKRMRHRSGRHHHKEETSVQTERDARRKFAGAVIGAKTDTVERITAS